MTQSQRPLYELEASADDRALWLRLPDADATEALGAQLARHLREQAGAVVYLEGDLGAGKTTLARGFLRALGVTGAIRSPTYTLIEPYRIGEREVLHLDLYRLNVPDELQQLGLSDYPPDRCLWLMEWPQRGAGQVPAATVRVQMLHDDGQRRARIEGVPVHALKSL